MNTLVHAQDGPTNGKAHKAASPVEFFEHHAHAVWTSDLDAHAKAVKLYAVSESILKYVRKAQVELAERAIRQDGWTKLACQRGTIYLEQLAADLRRLAIQCQNSTNGKA
ncbi:MAG TPA: hypothetical protein VHE55_06745 [Fimbriimonadaceae bacterium]|nr:hypothetical protein [Fimbriimonadaceae bacterium]